jgi:hypothetical protein
MERAEKKKGKKKGRKEKKEEKKKEKEGEKQALTSILAFNFFLCRPCFVAFGVLTRAHVFL